MEPPNICAGRKNSGSSRPATLAKMRRQAIFRTGPEIRNLASHRRDRRSSLGLAKFMTYCIRPVIPPSCISRNTSCDGQSSWNHERLDVIANFQRPTSSLPCDKAEHCMGDGIFASSFAHFAIFLCNSGLSWPTFSFLVAI